MSTTQAWTGWLRELRPEHPPGRWHAVCAAEFPEQCRQRLEDIVATAKIARSLIECPDGAEVAPYFAEWAEIPTSLGNPLGDGGILREDAPAAEPEPCADADDCDGELVCGRCHGEGERRGKRCRNCKGTGFVRRLD